MSTGRLAKQSTTFPFMLVVPSTWDNLLTNTFHTACTAEFYDNVDLHRVGAVLGRLLSEVGNRRKHLGQLTGRGLMVSFNFEL